jgi:hypothetical protein
MIHYEFYWIAADCCEFSCIIHTYMSNHKCLSIKSKLWNIHLFGYFILFIILQCFAIWCNLIDPLQLPFVLAVSSNHCTSACSPMMTVTITSCLPVYFNLQQKIHHLFICYFCYVHCVWRLLHLFCTKHMKSDNKDGSPFPNIELRMKGCA